MVKGDGKVQVKRMVTEEVGSDGKREFVHRFLTERQREKLRQEAREKGRQLIESGPGNPERGEVHIGGDLMFVGSSEGFRTVSKIVYVGLAFRAGARLAMGDAFEEVRAYVRDGIGKPTARLFVREGFLSACQQGPHQHSLIIAGRHDKKRVDAIVRLFGGKCYFVALSDHYAGADFTDTLICDAYRGEINGILLAHPHAEILQTEDVAMGDSTIWDDLPTSGQRFCDFLETAIRSKIARERAADQVRHFNGTNAPE
jgi:hypothetical protein